MSKLYMNDPQLECYHIAAHDTTFVAGRRFGKTHGIVAPWLLRNVQQMPGSTGGIVCSTFQQALTRTLPGTFSALADMGFYQNIHYVVGIKPSKKMGFAKPMKEPFSYDRVISWYNGSINILISQDIQGSSNSLTLQYLLGDEAKLLNFDKLKDETFPANGGYPGPWRGNPWLNSTLFVSDMPTTKKGSWFLNNKDKATPEIIDAIKVCLCELHRLALMNVTTTTQRAIAHYQRQLRVLRANAILYKECSSVENILILGEKYIKQMKRDLPPLVYLTSILCIRPGKLKDGFYPSLCDLHLYSAFDNGKFGLIGYDLPTIVDMRCKQDGDLQSNHPISISFDYNANINWLVAGQRHDNKMLVLKSFYVKYNRKLRELVDDFCNYYSAHNCHTVVYYYDTTALGSNYAVNDDDFAKTIRKQFEINGWRVIEKYIGQPLRHSEKYHMIDTAFKDQGKYLSIRINEPNNEALLLAMRSAAVRISSRGWEKDKSGEKYAETEEDRLEFRTDGTDAFDTLFIGMNNDPYNGFTSSGIVITR